MNQEGVFFELNTNYVVEGLSQSDMQWADLDNDSDQDLIITGIDKENRNQALYYTNLGNFNFFKEELSQDGKLPSSAPTKICKRINYTHTRKILY